MSLEYMSSELPPPFYTCPDTFSTVQELMLFQAQMLVNVANETRAMRLAIENVHKSILNKAT